MTQHFPLRTILSVTTGRLLTKPKGDRDNGISDLYELLAHMTKDAPYTHSLGRFAEECKPHLLKQYPELNNADLDKLDLMKGDLNGIEGWLCLCESEWGMLPVYPIDHIPTTDHQHRNPVTELQETGGGCGYVKNLFNLVEILPPLRM